ncbi:MAG: LacI family DNA-binding transcriptional regulator [Chloroflexota bacterium]
MTVSMDDVARQAGVSKSTVSIVLNDRPGASDAMRQRVMDAANAVGYQLASQRNQSVGVNTVPHAPVIALVHCVDETPDIDEGLTYLYLAYRNGIQRYTHGRDISVMLMTSYRDDNVDSFSYQLMAQDEWPFDGLILMGPGLRRQSKLIQRTIEQQIPAVILGRSWPEVPISSVSQDHNEQAVLVMDHLLALGHEKIGFVARNVDRSYNWFEWRIQAYREAMASNFRWNDDECVAIAEDVESAVNRLLQNYPDITAIFAMNDHIAYQTMRTLIKAGHAVPNDISVIGIDGVFKPQEGLPKLTTVTFPHEEVGFLAAETLVKLLENKNLRTARLTVGSHLVSGASCDVPKK